MSDSNQVYFAARKPEDCASALLVKGTSFFQTLRTNAWLKKISDMYHFYYGNFDYDMDSGHHISFTGEQGELVKLPVNVFRNLARNIFNMITAERPILEARAINSDYKSLSQTYLANGILDYYMREKGMEEAIGDAVEMAIVLGSSFIKMEWNAMAGNLYDIDPVTQEPRHEGELEFSVLSPLDVVVDGTKERWNNEWIMTRSWVNRYNLIAKYPEQAEKIMRIEPKGSISVARLGMFTNDDTDDIAVYEFFHKRTEAMPEGRYLLFLDSDIILLDAPLPYRSVPIIRLTPSNIMGTPYGYSDMFDVFPLQEALNALYSAALTNNNAFMVQNVFVERGSDLTMASIEGGLNIMEGNKKPEAVNLTATAPETYNFMKVLEGLAETQVGVNSVTRGNPEASLRSGNALALVQSMSLQFQSGFQKNYIKFLESIGTTVIEILKDFADTPKLVALVGRNKRPLLKEFTGDMIKDIHRVTVDVGNPLSRTTAGRVAMAEQLAQMKLIKNPQQYFMVMETGRLDTMIEGDMADLLLIKRENEWLLDGKDVFADPLDQHRMHILEHRAVTSDPELRENPLLMKKVQDHIQEHIDMLRMVNPDLLQLINEQPLNPMGPQQQQPGLPPGPMAPIPPGGAPPQGGQPAMPMDNQQVLEQSEMEQMMNPEMLGGQAPASEQIQNQPSVDASLLPNPSIDPRAK